jgi:hypothetical protein
VHLGGWKAVALYCLTGSMLDALFPFCPFGFSALFFTSFYCAQKIILNTNYPIVAHYRIIFEQGAGVLYVIFLSIFRTAPLVPYQFLFVAIFSQIFTAILSKKMAIWHTKIAIVCNNYVKYTGST